MLFFDIYASTWTELTFDTEQTFHDLEAEGHVIFAWSDTYLVGYSSLVSQFDTIEFAGGPLYLNYEYGCSENLAFFLTTESLYVFDAELGYWQDYDYGLPADFSGNPAIYHVAEDYLAVIVPCTPVPAKNLVYSLHTRTFNQLYPGCRARTEYLDHGFTSVDAYPGETDPVSYTHLRAHET